MEKIAIEIDTDKDFDGVALEAAIEQSEGKQKKF